MIKVFDYEASIDNLCYLEYMKEQEELKTKTAKEKKDFKTELATTDEKNK